jgi:hypothetical protein
MPVANMSVIFIIDQYMSRELNSRFRSAIPRRVFGARNPPAVPCSWTFARPLRFSSYAPNATV